MIRPPSTVYGSSDLAGDRQVTAEWSTTNFWFGDIRVTAPEWLLFVRATFALGYYWAIGKGHETGTAWIMRWSVETGTEYVALGGTFGNQCVALRQFDFNDSSARVGIDCIVQTTGDTYLSVIVTPDLDKEDAEMFDMAPSSQGFLDLGADGVPIFVAPNPFHVINGYTLGYPCTRPNATIGIAADARLADQLAIAIGPEIGTLALSSDIAEPHLSADGQSFIFWSHSGSVTVGPVPSVCPPLVLAPVNPMPDVALVRPARADFWLGAFMFNNAPNPEPNPHVRFGFVTIPIRLGTLPHGPFINAGQDDGTRLCYFAGQDGQQSLAQAVAAARPLADAAGVGLAIYADITPYPDEALGYYRPGDVLMPQCNSIAALEDVTRLVALGYPVVPSLGLQRMAAADAAQLVIAASIVSTPLGFVIFAKDRSDVRWAELAPYLDRWNSGIVHPAAWPTPESPMPTPKLPATGFTALPTGLTPTVEPGPTLHLELAHQPQAFGPWQALEVAASVASPHEVILRFTAANCVLYPDRAIAQTGNVLGSLKIIPASDANADSVWTRGRLNGSVVEYLSDPAVTPGSPNGVRGVVCALPLFKDDGSLLFT
jgi:hypothetical protein